MRAFQAAYIGRHEFPKNLSEFELRQWFTFDERDRPGIRKAFRSRYWIGAALHLGFLAMTGTTFAPDRIRTGDSVAPRWPTVRAEGARPRDIALAVSAQPDALRTPTMGS